MSQIRTGGSGENVGAAALVIVGEVNMDIKNNKCCELHLFRVVLQEKLLLNFVGESHFGVSHTFDLKQVKGERATTCIYGK